MSQFIAGLTLHTRGAVVGGEVFVSHIASLTRAGCTTSDRNSGTVGHSGDCGGTYSVNDVRADKETHMRQTLATRSPGVGGKVFVARVTCCTRA